MSAPGQAVAFQSAGGPVAQALIQPPYDVMPLAELVVITENPVKDSLTVRERSAALFARNCSVCHGAEGDGTGIVSAFWSQDATPPANLTGVATRGKTDGTLFSIVTHGQGAVPVPDDAGNPEAWAALTNMPPFQKLLTSEERWTLVRHIRSLQQG
jgi:mono/diheme cytochrome c family protein